MTDRELLNRVAQALDVAQSLLGKSRHHNQILDAYIELRQAIAEPDDPFYCGGIDEESKAALAQPEPHTTLYDVCQEILRLEAVQKELLNALKELLRVEATSDDGEIILEVARHNARTAIAKAEEQA